MLHGHEWCRFYRCVSEEGHWVNPDLRYLCVICRLGYVYVCTHVQWNNIVTSWPIYCPTPNQKKLIVCGLLTQGKGVLTKSRERGVSFGFWVSKTKAQKKAGKMKIRSSNFQEKEKASRAWAKEKSWRGSEKCLNKRCIFSAGVGKVGRMPK